MNRQKRYREKRKLGQVHYTYLYLREDETPYYVGKGIGDRAFTKYHFVPVPSLDRIQIKYWGSEEEALYAEVKLIARYGRKDNGTGILRNLTNGGEGLSGHIFSEEHRRKLGAASKGRAKTEVQIAKFKATRKENLSRWTLSDDTKSKMRKPKSPEHRAKLAAHLLKVQPKTTSERATEIGRKGLISQGRKVKEI